MQNIEELDVKPVAEITTDDVTKDKDTDTYQFSDEAALKLVLDDAAMADNFMNINQWAAGWTMADAIYQSPASQSAFDGGNVTQANVPKFTLSNHISSIVPRLMGGIFYENPPFQLRPRPNTTQAVVDQKTAVFAVQLDIMQFEEETERALDQMALLGTCMMKWGYSEYTEKVKKYVRKGVQQVIKSPIGIDHTIDTPESDDYTIEVDEKVCSCPWIKYCDIRTVLVDPGCRVGDIREAKWVIYRDYATYRDLERLRNVEGYDIPDEETLRAFFMKMGVQSQVANTAGAVGTPSTGHDNITLTMPEGMRGYLQHALPRNFKTSADPLQNGLMILERWDEEKIIVVLNFNNINILIRNEPNPYGKIPFYSANWRNIPDNFYGQGLGLLIGAEQLVDQGVTNLALDLLAYGLQPTAVRKKGFNVTEQSTRWKQGGIIDVDEDVDKSFKFLTMPPVPGEAWMFIQQAKADAEATSGANEQIMQGAASAGVRSTGMRSGTGAAAVIQANASRLDGPDGRFIRQIFEPWLKQMDELDNDYMPTSAMREILSEQLSPEDLKKFDHIRYRNADLQFEVLAGAHLGPRKEMQQMLPIIMQMMVNPAFADNCQKAGWLFDGPAIFKAFTDAAGYKWSQPFLRKMSPQEQQFYQQNSPAALQQQKVQAAQGMQDQKFAQQEKMQEEQQMGKAANQVYRVALESQMKQGLEE
jgi:hypothetical protein